MENSEIILIVSSIIATVLAIVTIYKHFFDMNVKKKEIKEKNKEKLDELEPKLLIQIKSKTISPTAAKLYIEIENKSNFDIYNIKFDLNFIKDNFFKTPPIFSDGNQNGSALNKDINKAINLCIEISKMYKYVENNPNKTDVSHIKNEITSSIYLLNLYRDILEGLYLDTIKYFDELYISEEIKDTSDVSNFLDLMQSIHWTLTGISYNLSMYEKKVEKTTKIIEKIKKLETSTIPIIDFQFFVFDDNYKKKSEIKFSSKEKIDIELIFETYDGYLFKENNMIMKDIKINDAKTIVDTKEIEIGLDNLYKSIEFRDWESNLSKNNLKKFKEIRSIARNDITVFIRYNNTKQLDINFYVEYQDFIKLLDEKFKTTQTIFAM